MACRGPRGLRPLVTSEEEATQLLADAYDNIQHAKDNNRIGIPRVAVSLAYYAAFYAAQSMVAAVRRASKTHSGLISIFEKLVLEDPDFPREGGTVIRQLFARRATADYDWAHRRNWTNQDAQDAIAQAEWFVGEVAAWHDRSHPTGS